MTGTGPDPGFLRAFAETRGFLLGRPGRFQVAGDGSAVLYLRAPPRTGTLGLYELDLASGRERELVTPAQLMGSADEVLSDAEQARRERQRITDRGFAGFELSPSGASVLLPLAGRLYLLDRATRRAHVLLADDGGAPLDARFSPDGTRVAFVRAWDLWVIDVAPGSVPRRLTTGGTEDTPNGLAEFVAQEEMARQEGYWWSPAGDALAFAAVDQRAVESFAIADPSRPERAPTSFRYPRPGRINASVRLGVVNLTQADLRTSASTGPGLAGPAGDGDVPTPTWIRWDNAAYPYLARVSWHSRSAPLSLYVQSRDQREAVLLAADASSGSVHPVRVDRDDAWINLERGLPRWLPDGSGFLHVIEGDRRELTLFAADGAPRTVLSSPAAEFLHVLHVAPDASSVVISEGDALVNRIVRVALADGSRTVLVADGGEHDAVVSPDGRIVVDTRVAIDALPRTRVLDGSGRVRADVPSLAETPPFRAQAALTTVVGASGRSYHASVVRPRGFVPGARHPVVLHVYGGPHALIVKSDERASLFDQWLADHGVIVVSIDNRGTPRRGPAWERAIKGGFGRVPLDDQVDALEALAQQHPELDLTRVGVYGWSFGGYLAALAVLRRPDRFHVAVAGAPVVDWMDYDTHYTERYLGLPDASPAAYHDGSLLPLAPGLSRPLLLVHGTADDNVYFFHSLKLADALLRAGRPFDFLPLPRVTHQIGDPVIRARVWERTAAYLLEHLNAAR